MQQPPQQQQQQQQQPPQLPLPPQLTLNYLVNSSDNNPDQNLFTCGLPTEEYVVPTTHCHPVSATIASIYSNTMIPVQNPYLALPQAYYSQIPPPRLTSQRMQNETEDLLFYIIHGPQFEPTTATSLRVLALREMYSRGWVMHEEKSTGGSLWVLDVSNPTQFAKYTHLDLNGTAHYANIVGIPKQTILLTFNPEHWTFAFSHTQPRTKAFTVDDLLK